MAPSAAVAQPVHHATHSTKEEGPVSTGTLDVDPITKPEAQGRATEVAQACVNQLNTAFASGDAKQVADLFRHDGWYKEFLVTQWDHRSINGPQKIAKFLSEEIKLSKDNTLKNFTLEEGSAAELPDAFPDVPWIMGFIRFETKVGKGRGVVRLAEEADGKHKLHALFLGLETLNGHEPKEYENRIYGVEHGEHRGGLNWQQRRDRKREFLDEDPQVVIVGAGQAGLMLGYRLGILGVPTVIIDRNERVGDNWRKRYASLVLHDPVQYDNFCGLPFPPHWPVYTPKDKLAGWMEMYAEVMELNCWMSSEITASQYDEASATWTLKVRRGDGKERTIKPKHCVVATGHSGEMNRPTFKGEEKFKGPVVHSSQFTSGDLYKGNNVVVVGSNNSGQDLSVNLVEHGWNVTQVQRSETYFMSTKSVEQILMKGLYSDPGPKTEDADLIFNSMPNPLHIPSQQVVAKKIADFDRKTLDGLTKAGFKCGMGVDDAGFLMSYFKRGGGYYLGTAAEDFIIDGRIKMKQGQEISHFTKDGVVFADGQEIKADLVVLATGYRNMKTSAVAIFGKEGEKINPVWGLDEEGELRSVWRASGHPALWVQAGNLALNRDMSKRLALNIKGSLLGLK